jgi:hypothetical protein
MVVSVNGISMTSDLVPGRARLKTEPVSLALRLGPGRIKSQTRHATCGQDGVMFPWRETT